MRGGGGQEPEEVNAASQLLALEGLDRWRTQTNAGTEQQRWWWNSLALYWNADVKPTGRRPSSPSIRLSVHLSVWGPAGPGQKHKLKPFRRLIRLRVEKVSFRNTNVNSDSPRTLQKRSAQIWRNKNPEFQLSLRSQVSSSSPDHKHANEPKQSISHKTTTERKATASWSLLLFLALLPPLPLLGAHVSSSTLLGARL